jgi:amidase
VNTAVNVKVESSETMLPFQPAAVQLAALRKGEISSVELLHLYLKRVTEHNSTLNAIVSLDEERARAAARAADVALAKGTPLGPLHGLPITVKDAYMTAGLRTTCGEPKLADFVPEFDADAVSRLRAAGAVIFGKTNVPTGNMDVQTVNPVFGTTNNPFDPLRTPGGSVGGGAAAVAAGLSSVEFASEIGGSTRIPAHFCGLFGHKTTMGAVPLTGHIAYGPEAPGHRAEADMACAGVVARSPDDIFPLLSATAGPLERDAGWRFEYAPPRATELRDFRVAAWIDDEDCPIDSSVRAALESVIALVEKSGGKVQRKPKQLPVQLEHSFLVFEQLVYGAFSSVSSTQTVPIVTATLGRLITQFGGEPARAVKGLFQGHKAWLGMDATRQQMRDGWAQFFQDFDVLLLPVTPTAAPPHHGKFNDRFGRSIEVDGRRRPYWDQVKWNALANIAGAPATAFPVATTSDGLPVGVQVMGPCAGDLTTIEFARQVSRLIGGYRVPPRFA